MFYKIKILKKLYLTKKKNFFMYTRSHSILKNLFFFKKIYTTNSLTWIKYKNKINKYNYKYGMFAFTRKPFAKPAKRISKKKR